jgi:hypothetical protein
MRNDHIFVMAPPRSGTKMLARALARCPDTYLITEHKKKSRVPEEQNVRSDQQFWEDTFGLTRQPPQEVTFNAKAFADLNSLWTANTGERRLILKNPKNIIRAKQIRQAFPNAQFVWLVRNPWAVMQSMFWGQKVGHKLPMTLLAREVLQYSDLFQRSAASWVYSIQVMREVGTSADIITNYENLVQTPHQELKRLADHLSLTFTEDVAKVPLLRIEDFRVAGYLLHRSPARKEIIDMIAPLAVELGYPARPGKSFDSGRFAAAQFLPIYLRHAYWSTWRFCRPAMRSGLKRVASFFGRGQQPV